MKLSCSQKSQCSFKESRSDAEMKRMGQKQFAKETYKKIHWVVNMYHSWHVSRNRNPDLVPIQVDLNNPETVEKRTFELLSLSVHN